MISYRVEHKASRRTAGIAAAALCLPLLFSACGQKTPADLVTSAKTYLAQNDRKAAVIQLKNALQAAPESAEARYLLGKTLLEQGAAVEAEVELRKAQRLGHANDLVVPLLAASLVGQREPKKAIDEFGGMSLDATPAKVALATQIGIAHALLGNLPQAEAAAQQALSADPASTSALLFRVQLLLAGQKFADAQTTVAELLRTAPSNADAWKVDGDLKLLVAHDSTAALASYRKSVELKPDFLPGHLGIVKALLQTRNLDESEKQLSIASKAAPQDLQVRFLQALVTYLKKDSKTAQDQVNQLLKVAPDSVQVLMLAGSIQLEARSYVQAEAHLAHALAIEPRSTAARRLLTIVYLQSGQADKAVATVSGGQTDKAIDPELYSVAADAFSMKGDTKAARDYYAKAAEHDPKDARKRTSLAMSRLAAGDAAGYAELQSAAAADTGISADIALIRVHLSQRQFDKALGAIDNLSKKQPGQPIAPYLRGTVKLAQRDLVGARQGFEAALAAAPSYYPAISGLTGLDVSERKLPEARARLVALIAKEPKNAKALIALAEVESIAGASADATAATIGRAIAADPADPAARIMLAEAFSRAHDPKRALTAAQDAAAALPDNAPVVEMLGAAQLQAGQSNQAIASFTKLTELLPNSPNAFLRLGQAQVLVKSPAQAEQSLLRAIALKPDFFQAQRSLAALLVDGKRVPEAVKIARNIQAQRPTESAGYKLEGDIQAFRKDFPNAILAYRSGLKQVQSTDLAVGLHSVLTASGNAAEAERLASEWQKKSPDDPVFSFYLGDVAMRKNDFVVAEAQYTKVTRLQPDNAAAFNNLAWTATQLKRDSAVSLAEKAQRLAPGQPTFMDTLAGALAARGEYARAIDVQRKAIDLDASDSSLKLHLAKLYLSAGDRPSAQAQLRQLQQLGTAYASQGEVSQLLKSM